MRWPACRRLAEQLFRRCDALMLPTVPFCPTLAEVAADPFGPNARLGTFTNFVNLCDLAAIAVPAGIGADGLPVGVTVLGPAWSEGRIAALADRIHRAFTPDLPPPAEPDALASDETALFCIGAHMSGLPLNPQITSLGGRFLRVARTEPAYRLHAMGNRPGMARASRGAAIEGEVWALPTTAIGALLAQVPPPLGFGTVALEDGPCLGFLAEPQAMEDRAGYHRAWRLARMAGRSGDVMMNDTDLEAFMDASAAVLGLKIAPAWRMEVRANLAVTFRLGGAAGCVRPARRSRTRARVHGLTDAGSDLRHSWQSATDIAAAVNAGTLTAREVVGAALDRIAARNDALNAFTDVTADRARARAAAIDAERAAGRKPGPSGGRAVRGQEPVRYRRPADPRGQRDQPGTAAGDPRLRSDHAAGTRRGGAGGRAEHGRIRL